MKFKVAILLTISLATLCLAADTEALEWRLPPGIKPSGAIDKSLIPAEDNPDMIDLGLNILLKTSVYIGPDASDPKKRLAGNRLSCASCHENGGTKPWTAGFVGISARFPKYNSRAAKMIDLKDRINGCMQRSLNGKPLDKDSLEMNAMISLMDYLSKGFPKDSKVKGQGFKSVPYIDRAANPITGKAIFSARCAACHGSNGQGILNPMSTARKDKSYIFPAIWGDDSFNTGAGMYRLLNCTKFVKQNMPFGKANLKLEEAYDVCAFVITQPRPIKPGREKDYPILIQKPIDTNVGPYVDNFSETEHKYGPYQPIIEAVNAIKAKEAKENKPIVKAINDTKSQNIKEAKAQTIK